MTAKLKLTRVQKGALDYSIRCVATAAQEDEKARKCFNSGDTEEALRHQTTAFVKAYDSFVGLMDELGFGELVDKALEERGVPA